MHENTKEISKKYSQKQYREIEKKFLESIQLRELEKKKK